MLNSVSFLEPWSGNANLPIGGSRYANQEIGVPGKTTPLVPKMPHAAEHHRDPHLVRDRDDIRIAY
jgi:hypothetical protein